MGEKQERIASIQHILASSFASQKALEILGARQQEHEHASETQADQGINAEDDRCCHSGFEPVALRWLVHLPGKLVLRHFIFPEPLEMR